MADHLVESCAVTPSSQPPERILTKLNILFVSADFEVEMRFGTREWILFTFCLFVASAFSKYSIARLCCRLLRRPTFRPRFRSGDPPWPRSVKHDPILCRVSLSFSWPAVTCFIRNCAMRERKIPNTTSTQTRHNVYALLYGWSRKHLCENNARWVHFLFLCVNRRIQLTPLTARA